MLNDDLRSKIKEIRIEGHTDNISYPVLDADPYIANVILSQRRALSVLRYFREMDAFNDYTPEQRKQLEYWLTANGLSYGKSLDSTGNYSFISNNDIDLQLSRRVEFRIVSSGDEVLENFVKKNTK